MLRSLLRISIIPLLALLAVSCRQNAATTQTSMAGELLVVGPWEMPSLDPLGSGSQFMRMQVTRWASHWFDQ